MPIYSTEVHQTGLIRKMMICGIQALSAKYLVDNRDKVSREPGCMVNDVPLEIDQDVARRKLAFWGCEIDTLTPEQHRYLYGE